MSYKDEKKSEAISKIEQIQEENKELEEELAEDEALHTNTIDALNANEERIEMIKKRLKENKVTYKKLRNYLKQLKEK